MIIVTGSDGRLGHALRERVGHDPRFFWATRKHFNIVDMDETSDFFGRFPSDLTVHLAAYTATTRAESERRKCYDVNVIGTRNVSRFSQRILYMSTDHVFDGEKGDYTEDDEPCPWSHYGWTKLLGEYECNRGEVCVLRGTFRSKPFPYRVAWYDSLTTALWIQDMAEALHWCIDNYARLPHTLHIGGKKQDYFSFAREDPSVVPGPKPLQFPKDLSLDSTTYRALRGTHEA